MTSTHDVRPLLPHNSTTADGQTPARSLRALLAGLVVLGGVVMICAVGASGAQAAALYNYQQARSEALGSFVQPHTLTFDAAGNLYVAEPGHLGGGVIDKFDESNALVAELGAGVLSNFARGVAVNYETGHVYVPDSNRDEVFVLDGLGGELSAWNGLGGGGAPSGMLGTTCCHVFDAVDSSGGPNKGQVYVLTDNGGGEVGVLEPKDGDKEEGKYLRSLELPSGGFAFGSFGGLAVNDSSGAEAGVVYVADPGNKVVDRFSAAGTFESQLTGPPPSESNPTGGFKEPVSVAVEEGTGDVWVADRTAKAVYRFSPTDELLTTLTEAAGEPLGNPISVAVRPNGPHKGEVYVTDETNHRIDVFALESPEKPVITEENVSQLTGDSALLSADVNPHGALSTYRFEYGQCSGPQGCPESAYAPVGEGGSLGSAEDFSPHGVSVPVQGLSLSTTYHFRVVAHNVVNGKLEITEGKEVLFTTQGVGGELVLPDDRMWELVSPPDKHGGLIEGISEVGVIEAAADGGAISYFANAPILEEAQGDAGKSVQVLSSRGAAGWGSRVIATPVQRATGSTVGTSPEYRFFSEDLSKAIVQPLGVFNSAISAQASEQSPYLRTLGSCTSNCYRPLVSGKAGFADVPEGIHFGEELPCEEENGLGGRAATICGPVFLGATSDLRHAVLLSVAPLTSGAPQGKIKKDGSKAGSLYEFSEDRLQLLSILPANEAGEELPAPGGATLGAELGAASPQVPSARRAISSDGSRIFWGTGEPGHPEALFMRDTVLGKTVQLDAGEAACIEAKECKGGGGRFQIASADGSRVFFTDTRRLTKDAGAGFNNTDLYECRIGESGGKPSCALSDLTPEAGGKEAEVQGNVLGASEDGEEIYFVAKGTLGTTQNASGESAVAGQPNLYLRRGGQTSFVAGLSGGDQSDWDRPEFQPTRVSPDGRWLELMSEQPLTGYDNHDAVSGQPDAEIFLHDADTGQTTCASCDPGGARPVGIEYGRLDVTGKGSLATVRGQWQPSEWVAALVPQETKFLGVGEGSAYQSRYLSNSGRLFFNALGGLVPQDVNGVGDVYEHEPAGVGGCETSSSTYDPHSGGCLGLISSGVSSRESQFLDASESGDDVFFLTNAKLSPQDLDGDEDVYDAHVCSAASPCTSEPVSPPPCKTEASCKASPTPQPAIFGAPPSATFNGLGNVTPAPVVKAKAKPPTRAQKLAAALKSCKKDRKRQKRSACEKQARAKYGSARKASVGKSNHGRGGKR
jgi:DNA-binding beta-propeller fold protein YncE